MAMPTSGLRMLPALAKIDVMLRSLCLGRRRTLESPVGLAEP